MKNVFGIYFFRVLERWAFCVFGIPLAFYLGKQENIPRHLKLRFLMAFVRFMTKGYDVDKLLDKLCDFSGKFIPQIEFRFNSKSQLRRFLADKLSLSLTQA